MPMIFQNGPELTAEDVVKSEAREALEASDITVLRCVERGIAVPQAWAAYREALREVVRTGAGELPARPDWS